MRKRYRPYQPDQCYLLPPSLDEWLPQNHLARFVNDVVDELDLSAICDVYEKELRGYPPYHPAMMTKVLVYAYSIGVYSSRKIERRIQEDIAFRYLTAGNFPDFRTINTFRKRHLKEFTSLFVQVLKLCREAGLVKLGTIAVDGTKVKANASLHKAMSYGRMKKRKHVYKRRSVSYYVGLRKSIPARIAVSVTVVVTNSPKSLPFARRLAKIREAKQALELEAQARAETKAKGDAHDDEDDHSDPPNPPVVVDDKAQRNFTDPDSRVQKASKTFIQGYNAQVAVDAETQVIVGTFVRNSSADVDAFPAILDQVETLVGTPRRVVADAGYYSQRNVDAARRRHIAPFIPPNKIKHSEWRQPAPKGPLPRKPREHMARFLRTKRGREIYKLRQQSVEPVFGQIKEARGFRRFSLRGMDSVSAEWTLVATVHNLLKLFMHHSRMQQAAATI